MIERHDFYKSLKPLDLSEDECSLNITQTIVSQIVKKEDEMIKMQIIDYAKTYAAEKDSNVSLLLLDETKVREILDLGIKAYLERGNKYE